MDFQSTALLLAWVAIVILSFAVAGLLRQLQLLASADVEAQPARRMGPEIGQSMSEENVPGGPGRRLVLFVDDSCVSCRGLITDLSATAVPIQPPVSLVFPGGRIDGSPEALPTYEHQTTLFDRLHVPVTPFAVVIDEHERVEAAEPVGSANRLRRLLGGPSLEAAHA